MFIYFTFFESFIKFVTKLVNIYTGWNNLSVCGNDVVRRQIFWEDSSWEGSGLRRQFLQRKEFEMTIPEKDSVWEDSFWKGLIRRFDTFPL